MDRNVALTYAKRKKRKKIAAIVSAVSSALITVFIIIAFCLITVDRFTVTIQDGPELSLTVDENKEQLTTELHALPLTKATDTQYTDIPENIDEGMGSKNTNHYFAYSFYLGGRSDEGSINYSLTMTLTNCSNEIENAMRVMIIRNGIRRVYAQADESGSPKLIKHGETHESEPEVIGSTIPFKDNKHIILEPYSIESGNFDRYTVVMWIDGWESVNSMKSGVFQTDLKFSTLSKNKI